MPWNLLEQQNYLFCSHGMDSGSSFAVCDNDSDGDFIICVCRTSQKPICDDRDFAQWKCCADCACTVFYGGDSSMGT